jgi:excisionase family DNA binding protein
MKRKETTMPPTKPKPKQKPKPKAADIPNGEVLTLAEIAKYLRVPEARVEQLVHERNLPGRWLGDQWRFHKPAVVDWLKGLSVRSSKDAQLGVAGIWKDDPTIDEMVKEIYRQRGRPMTENGE